MLNQKGIYAAYLRKSRADAEAEAVGKFETLAHHQQILTALADREGIKVARWYKELGSGDTIQDRPEMQALLHDVRSGLYDGVLVTEVSRLARGRTADQATVSEAFQVNGTLIITPSKIYDPSDDADETFIDFELFMSRQEYKYIRKRMKAGKRQALLNGSYINWRPPFGFDRDEKNMSLNPNEDAPFVIQLLHDFADGKLTVADAIRRMRSYTGQETWSYTSLRYLLTNPAYIGMSQIDVAPTVKVSDGGKVTTKRIESKKPTLVKAKWDGLIDEETRAKILARFGTAPRAKTGTDLRNPFSGLLRCGKCGQTLVLNIPRDAKPRFIHLHGVRSGGCNCASCTLPVLIEGIADALEESMPYQEATFERKQKRINAAPIRKKIADARKKQERLYDLFEDGTYTAEEFRKRRAYYADHIAELETQLEEAEAVRSKPPVTISTKDAIRLIRDPNTPPRIINDYLKSIIEKIDYFRESAAEPPRLFIYPKQ